LKISGKEKRREEIEEEEEMNPKRLLFVNEDRLKFGFDGCGEIFHWRPIAEEEKEEEEEGEKEERRCVVICPLKDSFLWLEYGEESSDDETVASENWEESEMIWIRNDWKLFLVIDELLLVPVAVAEAEGETVRVILEV
jgi:hypothetical protein